MLCLTLGFFFCLSPTPSVFLLRFNRASIFNFEDTTPPFFSQTDPIMGRSSDTTSTGKSWNTDESVDIIWDGLNEEERESAMSWMTTSKSWVLWKQHDSLSTTKKSENTVEEKLQSTVNMGEKHRTKVGREEVFGTKIGGSLDK